MRKLTAGVWVGLSFCCASTASVDAVASDPQVIVDGSRYSGGDTVKAGGHGVPLLRALERIVPSSYGVNVPNAGAWADVPVSWHGGESFVAALNEILAGNPSLQAHVNTDLHLVTVTAVAPMPGQTLPAAQTLATASAAPLPVPPRADSTSNTAPRADDSAAALVAIPVAHPVATSTPANPVYMAALAPAPRARQLPVAAPAPAPMRIVASTPASSLPPSPQAMPLNVAVSNSTTGMAPTIAPAATQLLAPTSIPTQGTVSPTSDTGLMTWDLRQSDGSVRNALARWSREAGWQFIWAVPTDFSIDAAATIQGTFEQALNSVVEALSHSEVPIQAILYKGNHVLRVTAKGAG
ncbi:toxin co-regulated pilus biosynthesis Q family protein [Paraburkholderia acidicola]|nr:toxin co-regulated pilus biosynthesis Q family protein [Paraburkholderia acidicola]